MSRLYHIALLALVACSSTVTGTGGDDPGGPVAVAPRGDASAPDADADPDPWASGPPLGTRRFPNGDLEARVRAPHAERVELCAFAAATGETERLRLPMDRDGDRFVLRVPAAKLREAGIGDLVYYGLRAFGPNWRFDPSFVPGSAAGFVADVDDAGNRMNPNKLLLDPYALEISHDPITTEFEGGSVYRSGPASRTVDSGPHAPKGVVLPARPRGTTKPPARRFADDVVYEVHVRGLTKNDPSVPEAERGTYAGAARRAAYLRDLGVTAVELLPVQETPNDQNDRTPDASGDNYWGYATLAYFAPDRRYAADRSPGGPSRELAAMVDAFHAEGIKVFVDVVYNHTAEGGGSGDALTLYGMRGLDNATFYELADDARSYVDDNGVGANLNVADRTTADLVVHSLRYWHETLGVDGFRFDLAPVVTNGCARGCYRFDRAGLATRIATELPARSEDGASGVDLVAEPWGVGQGTYQIGSFPRGWSEWNDHFRDTVRRDLNRLGVQAVTPRELTRRIAGSADLFGDDGRSPSASVNYVVSHDGMTLADLFSYDKKDNAQPFPYGPSNGGADDDLAFSQGGDPARQRAVARTALALAALSAGVPMITGGDERLRTIRGNDNSYNLDSVATWLDWSPSPERDAFHDFSARVLAFRRAHAALRPTAYWTSAHVSWLRDDGKPADDGYLDAGDRDVLGWMLDGSATGDTARAILVFYSGAATTTSVTLPTPPNGSTWRLAFDTSEAAEAWGNAKAPGSEMVVTAKALALGRRALVVLVAE